MASSCDHDVVPEDLLIEILSRLPVKSLLRFQCVCKNWYDLIKNPSFISKHFHHPINHTRSLVYYQTVLSVFPHTASKIRNLAVIPDETLATVHHLLTSQTLCGVLGPINGLFLLVNFDDSSNPLNHCLALCNPATSVCAPIPLPSFNLPPYFSASPPYFGFGLDPLTNDYKVVWIQHLEDDITINLAVVAIYTQHNDSWKQLYPVLDSILNICSRRFAYLDGAYYWLSNGRHGDNYTVVVFDMGTEVFREIKTPPDLPKADVVELVLHNDDSIALLLYDNWGEYSDIWVMKEEGCWTKRFNIGTLKGVVRPIGFWKNDEMIVNIRTTSELAIYDLTNCKIRNLGIHGRDFYIFNYKESLASAKRRGMV